MAAQPKPEHEFWAEIPSVCEPHRVLSRDPDRPLLTNGWIRHSAEGPWLETSDSYIAARIPITLHTRTKSEQRTIAKRKKLLPELMLPRVTMEALSKANCFRVKTDGVLELKGDPRLYPAEPFDGRAPDIAKIVAGLQTEGLETVAFNPELLSRLVAAIGSPKSADLEFCGAFTGIKVRAQVGRSEGLIMPIRTAREGRG